MATATAVMDEKEELTERELALARGEISFGEGEDVSEPESRTPATEKTEEEEVASEKDTASEEESVDEEKSEAEAVEKEEEVTEKVEEEVAETEEKEEESFWTDDARALAASYGLTEEDQAGFQTADEFRRAALLLDRQLVSSAEATEPLPKPAEKLAEEVVEPKLELDPQKYIDAGYDEDTVALVKYASTKIGSLEAHGELQNEKVGKLESAFREFQELQQEAESDYRSKLFHGAVNYMDEERFGGLKLDENKKAIDLTDKQDANRRKLHDAAELLRASIVRQAEAIGQEPIEPLLQILLQRAEQFAFADELRKQERMALQKKVAAQSKRRRPAPSRGHVRATPPSDEPEGEGEDMSQVREIANHPDVAKVFRRVEEEGG